MQAARAIPLPVPVAAAIVIAWIVSVAAQFSGSSALLHHRALIEGGPPLGIALALFIAAWMIMIAAMMLPSSLPLIGLFAIVSRNQRHPSRAMAAFLCGYVAVWAAFGVVAFGFDIALHRTVDRVAWLGAHPWMIAGAVLALAGAFQFTPLKDACLRACRLPSNFLVHHYRRGTRAAFELGYRHGLFCAGCCWALMLVGFAAGFASLWWMAALTALMVVEKTAPRGRAAVPLAGTLLLLWSLVVFLHPAWLPAPIAD